MASSSPSPQRSFEDKLRRFWIGLCVVVAGSLSLSQLLEIPHRSALRGYDNTFNYLWLRSAMVDHDWDFRNDLIACDTLQDEYRASALQLSLTKAGRIPNKYGIGWALLTLPFYVVADLLVGVGRAIGWWDFTHDGFNPVYQVCIQIGHTALAVFAMVIATRVISKWLQGSLNGRIPAQPTLARSHQNGEPTERLQGRDYDFIASSSVALTWAASSLVYYQAVNVSMSHGAAFFAIVLMAYGLMRAVEMPSASRWWWLTGASFGLAVIVRYQLVLFALPLGLGLFGLRRDTAILRSALVFCVVGFAPFALLQCFAWHQVYGEWFVFGYGAEGEAFHWGKPALVASLFSSWHGLFYWHPFLLVAAAGMIAWAVRVKREALAWSAAVGLMAYTNAAWWCWWFASAFGNRGYDAALLPLMAGTAWLLHELSKPARLVLFAVAIAFGAWNFYVVVLFRSGAISRSERVTWGQMIQASTALDEATRF
ncbi:MAG: hypothetical protein ABIZ04_05375 [Opitutus sp.]